MAGEYLYEAFQELDDLEDTTFELTDDGVRKLETTIDIDDEEAVEIYDDDAETEEDLEGSYIGKVILDCPVCRSKVYRDPTQVVVVDGGEVVNSGEECPYCMQADGYKIIGQVSEYTNEDSAEVEETEEIVEEGMKDLLKKRARPAARRKVESLGGDVAKFQEWVDYDMKRYGRVSGKTMSDLHKAGLTLVKDQYGEYEVIAKEKDHSKRHGKSVVEAKMKRRGKASIAQKLRDKGVQVGEEKLDESVTSVSVDTEDTHIEVAPEGDGAITVRAEDRVDVETKEETIVPVTDETIDEIEVDNTDEEDIDFTEFDEEQIDELGEGYLKKVYENVESYKTTKGTIKGNRMFLEGVITFKSGKKTNTKFVFEAKEKTKTGKLRFIGENKALSGNSKAFTLTGRASGTKLVCESLRYNYRAKDAKTGKSTPISGSIHLKK